jgi:hypothetical protein
MCNFNLKIIKNSEKNKEIPFTGFQNGGKPGFKTIIQ